MTLYKNKYRIESTRLPTYDYSSNGHYFVTICTHQKHCYFGKIVNAKMQLSQVGKIAQKHWQEIPEHFNGVDIDWTLDKKGFVMSVNEANPILMGQEK